MVDSGLVEHVVGLVLLSFFLWNLDLKEGRCRDVHVPGQEFFLVDLTAGDELVAKLLDSINQILAFARAKSTDKL